MYYCLPVDFEEWWESGPTTRTELAGLGTCTVAFCCLQVLDYESVDRSQQPLQYHLVLWVHEDLDTKTLSNNATVSCLLPLSRSHAESCDLTRFLCMALCALSELSLAISSFHTLKVKYQLVDAKRSDAECFCVDIIVTWTSSVAGCQLLSLSVTLELLSILSIKTL